MKITPKPHKPLVWVASTKKELMALPVAIRSFFGHALDLAQRGDRHDSAKVLHGSAVRACWKLSTMMRAARTAPSTR